MSLRLVGIGSAVPEHYISQAAAAEVTATFASPDPKRVRTLRALYMKAGVKKRHSVVLDGTGEAGDVRQSFYPEARGSDDPGPSTEARMRRYEAEAPTLAEAAAHRALADAGIAPSELTHVVTVSCTGFFSPGLDTALTRRLTLQQSIGRTHVGYMGCHGSINGLRVASSLTASDPSARVLLCSVELCTLHFSYGWNPDDLVANALFADGAAAAVCVPDGERGTERDWRVLANGTFLMPDSEDAMSWRIGDHGFRMTLSARVPDLIQAHVGGWLERWLAEHGLTVDDIGSWAVHPGGPRILDAFGDAAGLTNGVLDVSREVLADFGNMSSATVLFILERLRERGAPLPCVALGFGPGLVVEATLLG